MKRKTILLTLLTMLLWGSLFPMSKLGMQTYGVKETADILLFAGIRFTICGGVLCLFTLLQDKGSYAPAKKSVIPILLAGFFAVTLHYSFTYLGLELTDSSKTALLKQIGALFYICFSFLFIREDRPTAKKIFAAGLGFLGIIALNFSGGKLTFALGDVFILCASFCTVFSNVINKKLFRTMAPVTATGLSQLFGGLILLAAGFCTGGKVHFSPDASLLIMVYICIASIISYALWNIVLKQGQLSGLFIIKFAEPAFACIFGALILGENIWKLQYLLAFLLICSGIYLANTTSKKKADA